MHTYQVNPLIILVEAGHREVISALVATIWEVPLKVLNISQTSTEPQHFVGHHVCVASIHQNLK